MKGVLTGALALPASERAAFLSRACDDDEMRRRAESLLVDADSAAAFLETPALEAAAAILEESAKARTGPDAWPAARALRDSFGARNGRNGRGVPGAGLEAEAGRRRESAARVRVGGSGTPFAVRA